ncbi:MAG TPA: recombinase family protein [Candidatus Sulfotelmatobacter sp.]|nr:recombinase family protein [Candidatus Sulfotelmatobacter sp.]
MTAIATPVAQYLRMSTEHQQYSLENQSAAIQQYASSQGFEVVRTYSDAARSGLVLKRRAGLRQLLQDVMSSAAPYKAILVYDISRWGRFQDTDESAHYEFLCKSSGVPVHYCAESFPNDGSMASLIMKALKRTMAGEYSRELGIKVLAGQTRLAKLGYKQGGPPGYGLRRMLVSSTGQPKQQLADGERKSISTDRVVLVPGPENELRVVRDIFRMFVSHRMHVCAIAECLNRAGIPYLGSKWNRAAVQGILCHPKYAGCQVFNRTSCRLFTPRVRLPESQWVVTAGAIEPLVDAGTFERARHILRDNTVNRSDDVLLERLKTLQVKEGRLTLKLVKGSAITPSPSTYRYRFGSMRRAYQLIGYGNPSDFPSTDSRRTQSLRRDLMEQIVSLFPGEVSITKPSGRWRGALQLQNGTVVSVLLASSIKEWKQTMTWRVQPVWHEWDQVTLLARLNKGNLSFFDFHLMPRMDRRSGFFLRLESTWLNGGVLLPELRDLCNVVAKVLSMTTRPE